MSLKPSALRALGIEPDKLEQIMEMHNETLASIKADKDKAMEEAKQYKEAAEKLAGLEKQLEKLKEKSDKYDSLKKEYDEYKNDVTAKETKAAKTKAYRDVLKEEKVSEDWLDDIVKFTDLDTIELDENGKIKNEGDFRKTVKEKYAKYIVSESKKGAQTATPPSNVGGNKMTKEEILNIKDAEARQQAMLENREAFGF